MKSSDWQRPMVGPGDPNERKVLTAASLLARPLAEFLRWIIGMMPTIGGALVTLRDTGGVTLSERLPAFRLVAADSVASVRYIVDDVQAARLV
jgi:hypothetical protein